MQGTSGSAAWGGESGLVLFLVVDAWIVVVIMMIVKLVMFEGRGWCTGGSVPADVEKKLKDANEGLLEKEGAGISVTCEACDV